MLMKLPRFHLSQALREGAPGLRAKRRGKDTSSVDEDDKSTSEAKPDDQNEDQSTDGKENETPASQRDDKPSSDESVSLREPMIILPSARLLGRPRVDPIRVEDLKKEDRDAYLKHFLPPNETNKSCEKDKSNAHQAQSFEEGRGGGGEEEEEKEIGQVVGI